MSEGCFVFVGWNEGRNMDRRLPIHNHAFWNDRHSSQGTLFDYVVMISVTL